MRGMILALAVLGAAIPAHGQAPAGSPSAVAEAEMPISSDEARQTAEDFARMLNENFLFPDVARKYAERLRSGAARGEYDRVGTRGALASLLTRQLQDIHPDGHLRMIAQTAAAGAQSPMKMMMAPPSSPGPVRPATPGPGKAIEAAQWLAPGIAYIRFTLFPFDPGITAAAGKFMADHADAKVVIFDLRTHRGGGMSQMAAVLPYLFDKETVFLNQDTRVSNAGGGQNRPPYVRAASPSQDGVSTEEVFVTPRDDERRLRDAKVYVLTSGFTVSAGEAFAFGLKSTGRATLVGEATTGAGHFAPPGQRVNDMFAAFVPIGRAYDARSGKGWEGSGVAPDVEVPAEQALVAALVHSGVAKERAVKLSAAVEPTGPMRRPGQRQRPGS